MGIYRGITQLDLGMDDREIIVDNFAGGGGASTGIELALGRSVDIAINHDPAAIAMHKTNHPQTKHYCESVWDVDPVEACNGRKVGLVWFSPDCKHFSKAKGGKPVEKAIRGLAWVAVRWAADLPEDQKPRVIMLENVEEFTTWGPIDAAGQPIKARAGETFEAFKLALSTGLPAGHAGWSDIYHAMLRCNYDVQKKLRLYKAIKHGLGYSIEHRELRACDYGAPTIRKRFFMVARRDGKQIVWPEQGYQAIDFAEHFKDKVWVPDNGYIKIPEVITGGKKRWRVAGECIDFSLPVTSIFEREKPLAENTLRRIAKGIQRYVLEAEQPFIVDGAATFITKFRSGSTGYPADTPLHTITSGGEQKRPGTANTQALVVAFLAKHYGGNYTGAGSAIKDPLHTVTTTDHNALVTSHMIKLRGTNVGSGTDEPVHTISAGGNHIGEVRAFLIKYYGNEKDGVSLHEPLHTVTAKERFGLVVVHGELYQIVDIGMRMLEPKELFKAQGFPADYIIDVDYTGAKYSKAKQVARCGNAVPPPFAEALVTANYVNEVLPAIAA